MKKLSLLVLSGFVVLGLVGCSGGTQSNTQIANSSVKKEIKYQVDVLWEKPQKEYSVLATPNITIADGFSKENLEKVDNGENLLKVLSEMANNIGADAILINLKEEKVQYIKFN